MLTYLPGTYPKNYSQIDHSGALQQIRHFVPFWPFLPIFAQLYGLHFNELLLHVDPIPAKLTEVV